ncbi:MAG: hypothetical protein KM296_00140 [Brockia lithotrophica]|nr:hypothetical protein [Brockia lithotrophica]
MRIRVTSVVGSEGVVGISQNGEKVFVPREELVLPEHVHGLPPEAVERYLIDLLGKDLFVKAKDNVFSEKEALRKKSLQEGEVRGVIRHVLPRKMYVLVEDSELVVVPMRFARKLWIKDLRQAYKPGMRIVLLLVKTKEGWVGDLRPFLPDKRKEYRKGAVFVGRVVGETPRAWIVSPEPDYVAYVSKTSKVPIKEKDKVVVRVVDSFPRPKGIALKKL